MFTPIKKKHFVLGRRVIVLQMADGFNSTILFPLICSKKIIICNFKLSILLFMEMKNQFGKFLTFSC